jgi:uncharacterized membrane protein YqjE
MQAMESIVYLLCVLTSLGAMWLLLRSYRENGSRLLLWSAIAFIGFALNNLLLFVDVVLLPDLDLRPLRVLTNFAGVAVLLYGFIWEVD